jgi:uncharacterized SAM-binding protein YcdF (DUF218 family)
VEWPLCWTGILLILIGGEIAYPETFTAPALGTASLLTWLESIGIVLIRRFSEPHKLIKYNQKVLALMLLNLFGWLPLLFNQTYQYSWFNQQIILVAQVINGVATLGLILYWLVIIWQQLFSKPESADYLVVLGAGLRQGKVPPVLAARLDQAIKCWQLNTKAKIIVTGGILHGESISEAQAMDDYLVAKGIPQTQIILEERAMNTWENLKNCQKLLLRRRQLDTKIQVVTSSFHVLRTSDYLRQLGLGWPTIASKTPWQLQPLTVVRDYLGVLRDHLYSWLTLLVIVVLICEFVRFY